MGISSCPFQSNYDRLVKPIKLPSATVIAVVKRQCAVVYSAAGLTHPYETWLVGLG
jgi:hypothetical protein